MSAFLRRSIPAASRTLVRLHPAKQSSSSSCVGAAKRPFWQRDISICIGSQARSLATSSLQNQDNKKDKDGEKQWVASSLASHEKSQLASALPIRAKVFNKCSSNHVGSLAIIHTTQFWDRRIPQGTNLRYRQPPASIRSCLSFNQLVAANRAATDLAMRALMTWASSTRTTPYNHSVDWQKHSLAFVSTSSEDSRLQDPKLRIPQTKIPTPPSGPKQQSMKPEDVIQEINTKSKTAITSGLRALLKFLLNLPRNMFYYATHPSEVVEWWNNMKKVIKDEIDHYWVGTKLLWADLKTARNLFGRLLRGSPLTRRERKQLLRTISDLFRLVPFSMFLIIPLMEFALPFALKIFPNLLPSTFQDSLKAEENMKRELQSRIAMAKFFQETLEELAKEQKKSASHLKQEIKEAGKEGEIEESVVAQQEASAASFLEFMEKARNGELIPNDVIVRYAHYFKDDLTLDNMPRMQLINMCKYMGIPPYGGDSFLRFQLRHRMRMLQEDDQRILWEGIDSLTKMELREACQERGMRSTGLSKDAYKRALQQWLDLSVKRNVPTSLLIMSRTFFLREETLEQGTDDGTKSIAGLADAISGLDKEVVNEVILNVATSQEKKSDPGVRKIKLEVLMKQNELIEQEQAEREMAAAKEKEQAGKEKMVAEKEKLPSLDEPGVPDITTRITDANDATLDGKNEAPSTTSTASDSSNVPTSAKDSRVEDDLSPAEMDAISQLVSADPVSKERADLESIKAALQDEKNTKRESEAISAKGGEQKSIGDDSTLSGDLNKVADSGEIVASDEAVDTTKAQTAGSDDVASLRPESPTVSDDPVVAKLKKSIEAMLDKIEVQLSDVQFKIGNKLHVLDKDMDGLLSVEEIAEALQLVLKRKITHEEAMLIARQMDDNKDGFFTVQELIHWIETNQLVRFVKEGRDFEMDRIMAKQQSGVEQATAQPEEVPSRNPPTRKE